jgi:hypothetical protein
MLRRCGCCGGELDGDFHQNHWICGVLLYDTSWSLSICCIYMG